VRIGDRSKEGGERKGRTRKGRKGRKGEEER